MVPGCARGDRERRSTRTACLSWRTAVPAGPAGARSGVRPDVAPDYLPLPAHLPAVYADDAASFAQLESYLGLVGRSQPGVPRADRRAGDMAQPGGRRPVARRPADRRRRRRGPRSVSRRVRRARPLVRVHVPALVGNRTPTRSAQRREFLARAARLWRRRGTPRGFVDWFVFWFRVDAADRPFLVEHFKFGMPTGSAGEQGADPSSRATLFVPSTEQFSDFSRRREAIALRRPLRPGACPDAGVLGAARLEPRIRCPGTGATQSVIDDLPEARQRRALLAGELRRPRQSASASGNASTRGDRSTG